MFSCFVLHWIGTVCGLQCSVKHCHVLQCSVCHCIAWHVLVFCCNASHCQVMRCIVYVWWFGFGLAIFYSALSSIVLYCMFICRVLRCIVLHYIVPVMQCNCTRLYRIALCLFWVELLCIEMCCIDIAIVVLCIATYCDASHCFVRVCTVSPCIVLSALCVVLFVYVVFVFKVYLYLCAIWMCIVLYGIAYGFAFDNACVVRLICVFVLRRMMFVLYCTAFVYVFLFVIVFVLSYNLI